MAFCLNTRFTVKDASGNPLRFGLVYTYVEGGTSTAKAVYQDRQLSIPHKNPFSLDINGQADVYLDGTTSFVIKDKDGNAVCANTAVAPETRKLQGTTTIGTLTMVDGGLEIAGDLAVTGNMETDGAFEVAGPITVGGNFTIGNAAGTYLLTGDLYATTATAAYATVDYLTFTTAIAQAAASNNSLFLDSLDNVIKFKDSGGTVRTLY